MYCHSWLMFVRKCVIHWHKVQFHESLLWESTPMISNNVSNYVVNLERTMLNKAFIAGNKSDIPP